RRARRASPAGAAVGGAGAVRPDRPALVCAGGAAQSRAAGVFPGGRGGGAGQRRPAPARAVVRLAADLPADPGGRHAAVDAVAVALAAHAARAGAALAHARRPHGRSRGTAAGALGAAAPAGVLRVALAPALVRAAVVRAPGRARRTPTPGGGPRAAALARDPRLGGTDAGAAVRQRVLADAQGRRRVGTRDPRTHVGAREPGADRRRHGPLQPAPGTRRAGRKTLPGSASATALWPRIRPRRRHRARRGPRSGRALAHQAGALPRSPGPPLRTRLPRHPPRHAVLRPRPFQGRAPLMVFLATDFR